MFSLTIEIDLGTVTKEDFVDEIFRLNEGQALQELAKGKVSDFASITPAQKEQFVLQQVGKTFEQVYKNSAVERKVQEFRNAEIEKIAGKKK